MRIIEGSENQRIPIKAWISDDLEEGSLRQALNLASLPWAFSHIALMPDVHEGYGMPIGGVLAAQGVVLPNAVGVDIGCGVSTAVLDLPAQALTDQNHRSSGDKAVKEIVSRIMREIPVGFNHRKEPYSVDLTSIRIGGTVEEKVYSLSDLSNVGGLHRELESAPYQAATLGGGNHFIEIQREVNTGESVVMVHSGSRNFGLKVAKVFNDLAKKNAKHYGSRVPSSFQLDYLPVDDELGHQYLLWMNLALSFAEQSRRGMLEICLGIVSDVLGYDVSVKEQVQCHHNYASLEEHFGEDVVVHRKGAVRADVGELVAIPGAMGGISYIAEGLGNSDSFLSASHGAGRRMSRKEARSKFTVQEMERQLADSGVILGTKKVSSVLDEHIGAYKDIDEVMDQQKDLVRVARKLQCIAVVKG